MNVTDSVAAFNRSEEGSEFCGSLEQLNTTLLNNFKFYGQGACVVVFGAFGLIGNTLAIVTIASMSKVKLFYKLLICLAIFDVVFILTGGIFIVQSAFRFDSEWYNRLFPNVIYPAAGISMTGSTYSCMSIAAERFLGICYPNRDAWFRKFRFYVFAIIGACILIDAPRFFEVQSVRSERGNATEFSYKYTSLRTNPTYIITYVMWYKLLTTIALPFTFMLFFNIKVFSYYKRNSLRMNNCHERSLMIIFSCITVTFLFCHFPRVILNIYEFQFHRNEGICQEDYNRNFIPPPWFFMTTYIEKILLILNASANFVYYCFSGREFRNRFCHILRCDVSGARPSSAEEATATGALTTHQVKTFDTVLVTVAHQSSLADVQALILEEYSNLQKEPSSTRSSLRTGHGNKTTMRVIPNARRLKATNSLPPAQGHIENNLLTERINASDISSSTSSLCPAGTGGSVPSGDKVSRLQFLGSIYQEAESISVM